MDLFNWAQRWGIPIKALEELKNEFGINKISIQDNSLSEAAIQNIIRLEASNKNCRLWRNNVGAAYMQDGNFIRYGLANESKNVNKQIKSADLIGIRAVRIENHMIGLTIGQFVSREIKSASWKYTGTEREQAQLRWAKLIASFGGDACFATAEGTL